jgi:two-component system sensor histidine kinase TtrS
MSVRVRPYADDGDCFWALELREGRMGSNPGKLDESRYSEVILEAAGDGVYGVSNEGRLIFVNPAALKLCGYTAEEMIGHSAHEMTHHTRADGSHFPVEECPIYAAFRDGAVHRVEDDLFWRKDGTSFPVEYISSPIIQDGEIMGAVVSFRDITKRKKAEEALQESRERARKLQSDLNHAARLSAMGELASGLAHELNQPLTAISNYLKAATRFMQNDPEGSRERVEELMDKAADQAQRAGEIIHGLRQFVQKEDGERAFEDLGEVVREAAALAAAGDAAGRVRLEVSAAEDLPSVLIEKIRIQQVVVNLIRNAVDALENTEDAVIDVSLSKHAAGGVTVSVRDNGPGLAGEIKEQLFQSFVTSKSEGMGLGLSI